MASLEELKKRLYKKGETFDERNIPPELTRRERPKNGVWREAVKDIPKNKSWLFFSAAGVLIVLILAVLFYVLGPSSLFKGSGVEVEITGQKDIESGGGVSWQVKVTNKSSSDLEDAVLIFNFPDSAQPLTGERPKGIFRLRKALGTIKKGESVAENFDAYVFGGRGAAKEVSAVVEYRPKGASAVFAADASFNFSIVRSPVSVSLDLPEELRAGQRVEFTVNVTSQAEAVLSNLFLNIVFPDGFKMTSSSISPDQLKNNFWGIGDLKPGDSRLLKISGTVSGTASETKSFYADVGTYDRSSDKFLILDEAKSAVALRSPFLEVALSAKGGASYVAAPGEEIPFDVFWRNNLSSEVKNAILEIKIDGGGAVDFSGLRVEKGSFRDSTKSFVWAPATYDKFQNLQPGDSDTLRFYLKIKNNLPRDSQSSRPEAKLSAVFKNGNPVAGFEGVDLSGSATFGVKVSSRLQMSARARYYNSILTNSGPMPPQTGKETIYTITWSLANMVNDLNQVKVEATLPPYMNFKNVISPADADIKFDQNSGKVIWNVGRIPAGTGFLNPALEAAFQVGLIPAANQVDTAPVIINETDASGRDAFTDQTISSKDDLITTELFDDPAVGFNQRKVVQ